MSAKQVIADLKALSSVGVNPPVGGVTVIVALSSPATAVGVPGILGPATLFVTDSGPNDAASAPVGL